MDWINPRRSSLALAVFAALAFVATLRLGALFHPFATQTWPALGYHVIIQTIAIGVVLIVAAACNHKVRWRGRWDRSLWFCIVTVVLSMSMVGVVIAVEGSTISLRVAIGWIITAVLVGIGEELTFRGIGLAAMIEQRGVAAAVGLSALIFGAAHITNLLAGQGFLATRSQVIFAATAGLLFGWTYVRTRGNLFAIAATHCLYDLGLFLIIAEQPDSLWEILGLFPAMFTITAGIILQIQGIDAASQIQAAWTNGWSSKRKPVLDGDDPDSTFDALTSNPSPS